MRQSNDLSVKGKDENGNDIAHSTHIPLGISLCRPANSLFQPRSILPPPSALRATIFNAELTVLSTLHGLFRLECNEGP